MGPPYVGIGSKQGVYPLRPRSDFCSRVYVFGCKLSLVRLCDSDFGTTPVDDITIGITCAPFCFHTAHI